VASRNRGKPKSKLRDLSRLPLEQEDRTAVAEALGQATHPIAAAILGAVMVEHDLETLLRNKFKHKDDQTWSILTERDGPLHSFFSKIVTGYALGIYNKTVLDDLHILRNIRNVFAHSKKLIQFDHHLLVKELKKVNRARLPLKYQKTLRPVQLYGILCYRLSMTLIRTDLKRLKRNRRMARSRSPLAKAFATSLAGLGGLGGISSTALGSVGKRAPGLLDLLGPLPGTDDKQ
jgi:hypothetical protein